jgi:hypothetical protein
MLAALGRESHLPLNSHQTAESLSAIVLMTMASVIGGRDPQPRKMSNPEDFLLRLRLCRELRKSETDSKNNREPDQPHGAPR